MVTTTAAVGSLFNVTETSCIAPSVTTRGVGVIVKPTLSLSTIVTVTIGGQG